MIHYRPFKPDDADNLLNFLSDVHGPSFIELGKAYIRAASDGDIIKPRFILAELNDQIIGCCAWTLESFTVDLVSLSSLSVLDTFRGQGIGTNLIHACQKAAIEAFGRTVSFILVTYPEKNRLYEKIGFRQIAKDTHGGSIMLHQIFESSD